MQTFTTRTEAIDQTIVAPIEAGDVQDAHKEFDIDAIADKVLGDYDQGFAEIVDVDEFWEIVAEHAL